MQEIIRTNSRKSNKVYLLKKHNAKPGEEIQSVWGQEDNSTQISNNVDQISKGICTLSGVTYFLDGSGQYR